MSTARSVAQRSPAAVRPTSRRHTLTGRPTPLAPALLVVALLAGCGAEAEGPGTVVQAQSVTTVSEQPLQLPTGPAPTPTLPAAVVSADGSDVVIADISRILPLSGSLSEVVFSLGLGDQVVGRDVSADFPEVEELPIVSRGHDVSAESVLSLRPTVVLADTNTGPPEAIDQIRTAGIPVVVLPVATALEHVAPRIHAVAGALGVPADGERLAEQTAAAIEAAGSARSSGEQPTVALLYLRGTAGVYLLGGAGAGSDSLIVAAGGIDAGTDLGLTTFTPITSEALIAAAPDVLLLMTEGLASVGGPSGLADIPGVAQTPAGRNGAIVAVDDGLLLNFGPRTPVVLAALATAFAAVDAAP